MGCDIHAYIEYSTFDSHSTGKPYWKCFIQNAGTRDYDMFEIMAGVRGNDNQLFEQRGLPDDLGHELTDASRIRIRDDDDPDDNDGRTCTFAQADSWGGEIYYDTAGKARAVDDPDAHSHSWLTREEFAQCIAKYMLDVGQLYAVEWDVLLAVMTAFEERGAKTRLVFWFDN